MLKIKDNVDLKELEKFGFKHEESSTYNEYIFTNEDCIIYIDCKDRILSMTEREYDIVFVVPSVIYDLIQAGLVEEKPNLSDAERVILENIREDFVCIGKDKRGEMYFQNKNGEKFFADIFAIEMFECIKDGAEPYNIEELLKKE